MNCNNPYCNQTQKNIPQGGMTPGMSPQMQYAVPVQQPFFPQTTVQQYPMMGVPQTTIPYTVPVPLGAESVDTGPMPETPIMGIEYTQGYLRTQIGRNVKVEFLIGTNMLVDRDGKLVDVGISYIILQEFETDDLLLCDMYSIKFVRFYY